jgi:hypothetical protein
MLTGGGIHKNQPIDCSAQTRQHLPSTTQPRMGDFHYDSRQPFRGYAPNAASKLFPLPFRHVRRHHGLPIPSLASTSPRSRPEYPRVHNTPAFDPSMQQRVLFPSQTRLPPIGTGRPSAFNDDHQSAPVINVVSLTSRPLQPSGTFINPLSKASDPYLERNESQQKTARGATDSDLIVRPQRRISTSLHCRHFPPSQRLARGLPQHVASNRSGSSAGRSSVSSRRASQGEPQDRRNRLADNSSSRGIHKKQRDSSPRKAAVAARAAIAHSARTGVELECDEVSPKTTTRTWAQMASGYVKEEPPADSAARQEIQIEVPTSIKEERMEPSRVQTWAQIAAAKWMEKNSKQEKVRNEGFGTPYFGLRQLRLTAKDQSVKIEIKEDLSNEISHWVPTTRSQQKSVQFGTEPRKDCGPRRRGMRFRTVKATM